MMEQQDKRIVVATMHSDYLLEQMSNFYYKAAPGERSPHNVYVSIMYNGNYLSLDLPQEFIEGVSPYAWDFFNKEDAGDLIFYSIYAVGNAALPFISKCVDELIRRAEDGWLDCEDDHYDFYHSTVELLIQIAKEFNAMHELRRLRNALIKVHEEDCVYDGPGECSILRTLMAA